MVDNKNIKPITVKTFADHIMKCETVFVGTDYTNSDIHKDAFDFAEFLYNNTSAAFWEPFSRSIWHKIQEERKPKDSPVKS